MRNNIAFRLTAQNSLNMNEISHNNQDKNMMNTFKAGSDLRSQLNKVKQTNTFINNKIRIINGKILVLLGKRKQMNWKRVLRKLQYYITLKLM
jgi:hypothetical protein